MSPPPTSLNEMVAASLQPAESLAIGFITNHPFLWFAIAAAFILFYGLKFCIELIPQAEIFYSKLLRPIAERYQHNILVKAATRSDIVGHVNRELASLRSELPKGWVPAVKVEWVRTESRQNFLDEGEVVLRIRPLANQERNFVNTTYHFLRKNFFPKTKGIIPRGHQQASVLYLSRKVINARTSAAREYFEDSVLEPAVKSDLSIPKLIEDYERLDERGFFTGTFLRELQEVAREVRFTSQRRNISKEANGILKHINEFMEAYVNGPIPSPVWSQIGPVSSYGLLLVAHPRNSQSGNLEPFVDRAKERLTQGAQRLYIFGISSEREFVKNVIEAIQVQVPEYALQEIFDLALDYRGNKGGIGALFINRQSIKC